MSELGLGPDEHVDRAFEAMKKAERYFNEALIETNIPEALVLVELGTHRLGMADAHIESAEDVAPQRLRRDRRRIDELYDRASVRLQKAYSSR